MYKVFASSSSFFSLSSLLVVEVCCKNMRQNGDTCLRSTLYVLSSYSAAVAVAAAAATAEYVLHEMYVLSSALSPLLVYNGMEKERGGEREMRQQRQVFFVAQNNHKAFHTLVLIRYSTGH